MPIPESSQALDGVIEGLIAMLGTTFSLTQDATLGVWSGAIGGRQAVVCEGNPGSYEPDIIISIASDASGAAGSAAISRPTMGTNRSREIAVEINIAFSVLVYGADIAGRAARQALNALLEPVQLYFRIAGQEVLGGSCREAWVSGFPQIPHVSNAHDSESGAVVGRFADAVLTVTALIRN